FHVGSVPITASMGAKRTRAYVEQIEAAMDQPRPTADDPRWRLALYLWGVRRYELKGGSLPQSSFATLFDSPTAPAMPAEPANLSPAGSSSGFLKQFFRKMRATIFGAVPLVTILHPDWLDFHRVGRDLRSVVRRRTKKWVYLSDDTRPVLGRILGP